MTLRIASHESAWKLLSLGVVFKTSTALCMLGRLHVRDVRASSQPLSHRDPLLLGTLETPPLSSTCSGQARRDRPRLLRATCFAALCDEITAGLCVPVLDLGNLASVLHQLDLLFAD